MASKKKASKKATKKSDGAKATRAKREGTITEFVQPLILDGKLTREQLIEKVKAKFPDSAFKASHVSWHRAHLKLLGKKVPDPVRPD